MLLSLTVKLSLDTIVFISLLKCMNCDCGEPGVPYRGRVYKTSFSRTSEIRYECEGRTYKNFHNEIRICREGKWTGRVPKCGNY